MATQDIVVPIEAARATPRLGWLDYARAADVVRLMPLVVQLLLAVVLVQQYQIENRTLYYVLMLATGGFVVHALLPLAYRLPFFVFLSTAGIVVALGAVGGAWLVGIGLVLIGLCHLPVRYGLRIGLVLAVGAALAAARGGWLPTSVGDAVWPILGAMFMFRLALYLHALKHDSTRPDLWRSLAYFFMLPNVAFPLYPVVDYTTFHRTYYDRDALHIYETGVKWIVRGLVQLLLYRFVYLYAVEDPAQVLDLGGLVQFMLGTFLLYLRVSGSFHLIVGLLHLFGFRLPETHHLYFLSSSFTDFWRRINIYWKDFMMKLVYYPSYFRLRRWGNTTALVGATAVVFLATWLLHSYQWFWLRGGFPLEAQDAIFWGLLGGLVVVNSLREMRRGRARTLAKPRGWQAGQAFRTLGTFAFICVLWSLWSADSVGTWLGIWFAATVVDPSDLLWIGAGIAVALAVAGYTWDLRDTGESERSAPFWRQPALRGTLVLVALLAIGRPEVHEPVLSPQHASVLSSLRVPTLNARDTELQHRGYYENLDNPSRMSAQLWGALEHRTDDWPDFVNTPLRRSRDDFLRVDMSPSMQFMFKGALVTTNEWGARGPGYAKQKDAGTVRLAVLGPSHVMGWGVADHETFAADLERLLNDRYGASRRFEVMNFAVPGHSLLQQMAMLDDRVFEFAPDVVIVTSSANPLLRRFLVGHILTLREASIDNPYEELEGILQRFGVESHVGPGYPIPFRPLRQLAGRLGVPVRTPYWEAQRRLQLAARDINAWALGRTARVIVQHGAIPILLAVDVVRAPDDLNLPEHTDAVAAGFDVWNLLDVYEGHDYASLRVAEWDDHPNAIGHRLIAEQVLHHLDEYLVAGLNGR